MSSSLAAAYRRYFPLLVRKCARMLGDAHEAQDVAQESFVRLHQAGLCEAEPQLVTAWLYRTSTRLAIDRLRATKRRAADASAVDALLSAGSAETHASAREFWQQLSERMPLIELEVVMLTRIDGLTQAEVSEVTGIHPRRVRRFLTRFETQVERLQQRERTQPWMS